MKTLFHLPFLMLCLLLIISCKDENVPNSAPPAGENVTAEIIAQPGDVIAFKGTFSVENGFKEIILSNEELLLDKHIVFANHVTKYFLDYRFEIPQDAPLKIYEITINAVNLSGNSQSFTTSVDVATAPESDDLITKYEALPGTEIIFTGSFKDEQGISSIHLVNGGILLDSLIELDGQPKEYVMEVKYIIPLTAEKRNHNGKFSVKNIANRESDFEMSVNLSGEDIVYDNIYTAGGFQWWTWRPDLGFPMDPDPDNDGWFEILLHCWDGEFEELKFLGQLDWSPDNWGLVDNTDPSKGMLNDQESQPVLLGANGGNPAYKTIRFNPYQMQYSVEDYSTTVEPREEMYIVGNGFPDYPDLDWNPEAAIKMVKNPYDYGEHIYIAEGLKFSENVSIKFIGQNTGWSPYDAGFDIDEQYVTAPVTWVKIKVGDGSKDLKFENQAGTYTVLYDYYLGRVVIWKEE